MLFRSEGDSFVLPSGKASAVNVAPTLPSSCDPAVFRVFASLALAEFGSHIVDERQTDEVPLMQVKMAVESIA